MLKALQEMELQGCTVESEREMFAASAGMEGCSLNPSFSLADYKQDLTAQKAGGGGDVCGVLQQRLKQMGKTVIYDRGTASPVSPQYHLQRKELF